MNYSRFSLVVAVGAMFSASAFAAPVIMLQFGSFETRDEAQARLSEVQTKHAALLTGLESSVREVKLPPDNLTVYRTQAGPVANRATAQSTCAKLAGSGDECYVVETAMIASPASSQVASAASAKNYMPPSEVKEVSASQPATPISQAIPALPPATLPPISNTSAVTVPPPADLPPAPPSSAMQAAMDRAVNEQNTLTPPVANLSADAQPTPPRRSFWSRLNPFSSEDELSTPSTPPVAAALNEPSPMIPLAPAPSDAMPAPMPVVSDLQPLAPAVKASELPKEIPPAAIAPAPVAPLASATMVALPPPPAPLMAQPSGQPAPLPSQSSYKVLPPAPVEMKTLPPAPLPVQALPPAPPMVAGNGTVRVEEAKRVPLSEARIPLPTPVPGPVSLSPSATVGEKTLWAQIGEFPDNQTALAFWDRYRQMHPDFPVVRVRTTSSLQRGSNNMVSLRVGPFARNAFINSLCYSLSEQPVRCGKSVDLGVAASPYASPSGYLPGSRYRR